MGLPWRVRVKDSGSLVKKLGFKVYEGFRFMAEDFRMKSSCFGAESSWLEVRGLKRSKGSNLNSRGSGYASGEKNRVWG